MPRTHSAPAPFLYDVPSTSSSASIMHNHPARAVSPPLHFLYPANVLAHAQAPAKAKKAARGAADISRLLDPAYLPSSARTASGVYVDPSGDAHDPDYRHFPAVSPPHTHTHHNHTHHTRGPSPRPRPHFDWELAVDESALDDEYPAEDDEAHSCNYNHNHNYSASRYPARRSWGSAHGVPAVRRPRESSFSTYATSATPTSPTGTASTLPTSYGSDGIAVSPFDDKEEKEGGGGEKRKRRRLSKGSAHGKPSLEIERDAPSSPTDTVEEDIEESDAALETHRPSPLPTTQEYAPSCAQGLRRQWAALALSVRFGVFRAQRRMSRRVQSLL